MTRATVTLEAILDQHHAPRVIDYLSLDVEGHEWEVLGSFPFGKYTFRAVTIERPSARLLALLRLHNYSYARHLDWDNGDDIDQLWVHASMARSVRRVLTPKLCGCCCRRGVDCTPRAKCEASEERNRKKREARANKGRRL